MEISRKWRFSCLFVGLLLLTTTLQAVQGEAELEGPSESECRPYIEKALKELETAETEPVVPVVQTGDDEVPVPDEEATDDSEHAASAGDDDIDQGDGGSAETSGVQQEESTEAKDTVEVNEEGTTEDEQLLEEAGSVEEPVEQSDEPANEAIEHISAEATESTEATNESTEGTQEAEQTETTDIVEEVAEPPQEEPSESEQEEGEAVLTETESTDDEPVAEAETESIPTETSVEEEETETTEVSAETQATEASEETPPEESEDVKRDEEPEPAEQIPNEEPQADEPQADEPQADEPQADEPQADEPEGDEPQADDAVFEQPQSEELHDEEQSVETQLHEEDEIVDETAEKVSDEAVESLDGADDSAQSTEATETYVSAEAVEGTESVEATESVEKTEEASAEATEAVETTSDAAEQDVVAETDALESTAEELAEQADEPTEQAVEHAEQADEPVEAEPAEAEEGVESKEQVPEEDLSLDIEIPDNLRPRDHIDQLLKLDDTNSEKESVLNRVAESTLRELKRLYENAIKPLEMLYKYRDLSNRHFGDSEIFSKPLVVFMGPWSGGKSSLINYLLDNEYSSMSLRTGAEPSPAYFNLLMYGEQAEVLDGTQLAADFTFAGLQKFGQGLEERLRGLKLPSKLLQKINIVEIPGILEVRKQVSRVFPFNDACQWFIDRADIIFLVYDPSKLDVGPETEAILDQLKGREHQTRIILNKADQVKPEELMRVQGALIWNISPLMSSAQPPLMYTTSLWSRPYESWAPVRLLQAQERAFLRDLRSAVDKRIENKIASARRFAVRVRNHAKMVDCYLTTYYNHKSMFGNRKQVSDQIIEHPQDYHIYEGLSTLTNISRYDLPDPDVYKDFFRLNPLYDFQQLSATCTYFRGCPINRLDVSIAYDLPELVGKHKKLVDAAVAEIGNES